MPFIAPKNEIESPTSEGFTAPPNEVESSPSFWGRIKNAASDAYSEVKNDLVGSSPEPTGLDRILTAINGPKAQQMMKPFTDAAGLAAQSGALNSPMQLPNQGLNVAQQGFNRAAPAVTSAVQQTLDQPNAPPISDEAKMRLAGLSGWATENAPNLIMTAEGIGSALSSTSAHALAAGVPPEGIPPSPTTTAPMGAGSNIIPGAKELLDAHGFISDPSMYSTSKVAGVLKNMWNQGLFSADGAKAINNMNKGISDLAGESLTTEMAGQLIHAIPPSELAQTITDSTNLGENLQKEIERRMFSDPTLYGTMDRVPVEKQVETGMLNAQGKPLTKTAQDFEYQRTGGVNVPVVKWKQLAQEELAKLSETNFIVNPDGLKNTVTAISKMPDYSNFATTHFIRSELLSLARDTNSPGAESILNTLVHSPEYGLSAQMDEAANNLKTGNPEAYQHYLDAKEFFKSGKETFNNDLLGKTFLSEASLPEKVGQTIFKGGNTTQVQQLKPVFQRIQDLVENPENVDELNKVIVKNPQVQSIIDSGNYRADALMNKVRTGALQAMFSQAYDVAPKSFSGSTMNYKSIIAELDPKANPEGYNTLKALFPEEKLSQLRDWAKASDYALSVNADGYNKAMMYASKIIGAGIGETVGHMVGLPIQGAFAGGAATLLGEGNIAAKILMSPRAAKWFVSGITALGSAGAVEEGLDNITKAARIYNTEQESKQNGSRKTF